MVRQCRQTSAEQSQAHASNIAYPENLAGQAMLTYSLLLELPKKASKKASKVLSLQPPSLARCRCPSISDSPQEPFSPRAGFIQQ